MSKPRPLTQQEIHPIQRYSYCQFGMRPRQFQAKWEVNYELIATICDRSISTVRRWFVRGSNYLRPNPSDLRHLAIVDFLLEHLEEIPEVLRNLLCPPESGTGD